MGEYPNTAALKLALQTVVQKRTCPPESLLIHWKEDAQVQRHVQSCLFCRERLEIIQDSPDLSELASAMAGRDLNAEGPDRDTPLYNPEPAPGQIWSLKPHLAGWGPDAAYFSPPLVLIVSLLSEPIQAVRVVQIFHEPDLAGPGDVEISSEQGLAEAWNIYTLAVIDLDSCRGSIHPELLETVHSQAQLTHPDPEPHSVLQAFRELELKTGYTMATRSLSDAMAPKADQQTLHTASNLLACKEISLLRTHLQNFYPELNLPADQNLSAEALLGLAQWTDLPLAAADTEQEITATCVWFDNDDELHLAPVRAEITIMDISEHGLFIAGRFSSSVVQPEALYGWWVVNTRVQAANEAELSPDGLFFQLNFAHLPPAVDSQEDLKLLLVGRG